MPNTSATGGILSPAPAPAPLEGEDLNNFLQQWFVQLTGLDGTLVRPYFQGEPPNIPDAATAWMAFRYLGRPSDTFPYVTHSEAGDTLQRQEMLEILCSFYDLGTNGQANKNLALCRDGAAIPQNSEYLRAQGFAVAYCGEPRTVPVLVSERWLYRVDLPVVIRRQIDRTYPVEDVASAQGTLEVSDGVTRKIAVSSP